jgi:hypothetical protein
VAETTKNIRKSLFNTYDYGRFVAITLKVSNEDAGYPLLLSILQAFAAQGKVNELTSLLDAFVDIAAKGVEEGIPLVKATLTPEFLESLSIMYPQNEKTFLSIFGKVIDIEGISLEPLIGLLKNLPLGDIRKNLQDLLVRAEVDMTAFYLDNLKDKDAKVVVSAIEALGEIGSEQAIEALAKALLNNLSDIRKASIKSMKGVYNKAAKLPLLKALKDPERDIRMSSLSLLQNAKDRTIGSALVGIMRSNVFDKRDEEERGRFFEVISKFPSPMTIGYIDQLLSEKNLTRNKKVLKKQQLAVNCLIRMESPDAKPLLEKCAKRWFLPSVIKSAAKTALQRK